MPPRTPLPRYPVIAWLERRSRRQVLIAGALVLVYLLYRSLRMIARIILDRWWYDSVTDAPIWSTMTAAKLQLFAGATIITALIFGSTVWLVLRSKPVGKRPINLQIQKYHERVGPAHRWALIALAVYLSLHIGVVAMSEWPHWVLFLHGPEQGVDAPEIGGDLGYHLFRLPFLTTLSAFLRQLVVASAVVAVAGHIMAGAIRLPGRGRASSPSAWMHLGLLAATYAGLQALDYVLVQRPSLATNRSGSFDGPGYTELKVIAPALWLMGGMAFVTAFLFVNGVRTGKWRIPIAVAGAWAVLHVALLVLVPGGVQTYVVQPAEAARQMPYIEANMQATRSAYRLDAVDQSTLTIDDGVDEAAIEGESFERIPLFGTSQLVSALQVLQGTTATRISDVDLDRYEVDGEVRPVMLAARTPSRGDLPEKGWVQTHLVYTHGDGIVAVPADTVAGDDRPDFDALPGLSPLQPELYFADGMRGWYAIVGTKRVEQGDQPFAGDTGIKLDSPFKRLVLALSTGEIEPLTSAELTSNSQLLYRRDVRERLQAIAPFLAFDSNPYPVITDDHVEWVVDGYTTSSRYPYAQFAPTGSLPSSSDLSNRKVNYVHASVKATVNAYDGTVHLYRTEVGGSDDPILDAWEDIFPDLIEPIANMPGDIRAHLQYPDDLLAIQTAMLGRYHVDDAETLFNGTDRWAVSPAVSSGVAQAGTGTEPPVSTMMPGSGELAGRFVALLPFSPGSASNPNASRNRLAAVAIADHDDPEKLRLVAIERAGQRQIASPLVAQSAIDADPELARIFESLNANGSAVHFGPMTPMLLDDGVVWLRPIILTGTATTTAPRLFGVVAVSNGLVGLGHTAHEAVESAVTEIDTFDPTFPLGN